MNRMYLILAVIVGASILCSARSASAQRRVPYRPDRPTLGIYLRHFQSMPGGMGNYHNFVRPEMEYRDTMRRQQSLLRRQGTSINSLQQHLPRGRRSDSRSAPTASVFMNYSHYYPGPYR